MCQPREYWNGKWWKKNLVKWKLKRYRNFPGSRLHRHFSIALITFIVYDFHIKIIFAWFGGCVLINNNFSFSPQFSSFIFVFVEHCLNLNFYWFCLCRWGRKFCKHGLTLKWKWCNVLSFLFLILFQLAIVIRLVRLVKHAITRQGNVLARMASRVWHVIDVLEDINRVDRTLLHALVRIIYLDRHSKGRFWRKMLSIFHFILEIPRVINVMMTQNEAPDPPNEDPTYERYQSSEQRGKLIILF